MRHLWPAALAAVALIAVPSAYAGPSLHVGVVEDAAIWQDAGAQMDLARLAGFDTVRMTAQWSSGTTQLTSGLAQRLQRAAQAANARAIQPIVSIYNTGASSTPADPASQLQFVEFARSVARALPQVQTYIVGNEPNSNLYWMPQFDASGNDVAAPAYEQLLAASYDAIKQIRPFATVIGGALDPRGGDNSAGLKPSHSPTTFISDLGAAYRTSGRTTPLMDQFDEHVYADTSALPPSMPHAGSTTVAEGDYPKLVSLLGKAFDGTGQAGSTLPILYGEFGVETTVPAEKAAAYSGTENATAVDEATQAAYYTEAFKLALCQPNVVGILVFHTVDEAALGAWQSGLYYADGTPKSSLGAIRDAAEAARAGTLTSCPDATAPTVALSTPPLPTPPAASVPIAATATDDVGVGKVELWVDGAVAGVKFAPPYAFDWTPTHEGRTAVEVRATDAAGNVGRAALVVTASRLTGTRGDASGTGVWRVSTPPANDLFADAQQLSLAAGRAAGSTAFATLERGEPHRAGAGHTVWFHWRAPASGSESFRAPGLTATVYTGSSVGFLRRIGTGTVKVARGIDYRIAVDGPGKAFTLVWRR